MRELKCRIWCGEHTDENPYDDDYGYEYYDLSKEVKECFSGWVELRLPNKVDAIEQYTGLKDKNGKEIYENCELDGRYIVKYIAPCFVGRDIVNGDIIELYDNKFTITKEHSELSQNSKRGFD